MTIIEKYRLTQNKVRRKHNITFVLSNSLLLTLTLILIFVTVFEYNKCSYVTRIYGTPGYGFSWSKIYFQINKTFTFVLGSDCGNNTYAFGKYEIHADTITLSGIKKGQVLDTVKKIFDYQYSSIGNFKYLVRGDSIQYLYIKPDTIEFKKGIIPIFTRMKLLWE